MESAAVQLGHDVMVCRPLFQNFWAIIFVDPDWCATVIQLVLSFASLPDDQFFDLVSVTTDDHGPRSMSLSWHGDRGAIGPVQLGLGLQHLVIKDFFQHSREEN